MNLPLAFLIFWGLASLTFIPGLLMRLGIWKGWYLAKNTPPFGVKGFVYLAMPVSALFISGPFMALIPVDPGMRLEIWSYIGVAGFVIGIVLAIWQPWWAKPEWLRRLEDNYDYDEIKFVFLPAWRQMNHKEWGQLIETEAGLKELIRQARSQ